MRPGQQHQNHKRMRGRNRGGGGSGGGGGGRGPNPLHRSYESNGPDVKVRGTAQHVAEKYLQLARDAQASGDRVMAENYLQHAEHYFRLLAAAQAQFAPHLPAYVRPDEQVDDDEDFEIEDGAAMPQPGLLAAENGQPPQQPGQGFAPAGGGEPRREFRPRQDRFERGERNERFERGDRQDGQPRQERFDRRDRGDRPNFTPAERPEMGEQPTADYPVRSEAEEVRPPRPPRPERTPRPERAPRPEPVAVEEVAAPAEANGEAPAEEGREPGLPSFLTRSRRRGRPAYRQREAEGEEVAPPPPRADDETETPPTAVG